MNVVGWCSISKKSCRHQAFPLSIPGWDKLRAWSALQWNKSSLFCSWCDFNSPPVEFTPLHTPRLKPIHHLSLQNRIRGFKKHRSFAFSIQFLKLFFFCINGREHCSHVSKALEKTAPPQGMNNLPRAEQQNIACFRAGRGFELRCTEVKNKQWFFPLPFLYYKGFFSMMFLSQSQSWMA